MSADADIVRMACPCLTADLPGVGGAIKREAGDFFVQELPLYEATGEGTHCYVRIEKVGLTTLEAISRLARALGRRPRDVGYAGLKDAQAVTQQTFSIEHIESARIEAVDVPGMRVLSVARHTNKLKRGHLRGNRFAIRVRGVERGCTETAQAVVNVLRRRGVPNYFGSQRFGARQDNWIVGGAVVRGDYGAAMATFLGQPGAMDEGAVRRARQLFDAGRAAEAADTWPRPFREQRAACRAFARSKGDARRAWEAIDRQLRQLLLSAYQSRLFNCVLESRIDRLDRVLVGDMAYKHVNGACFRVEDAAAEQPRCETFEISPTGPLFGSRMTEARGVPGEIEAAVLAGERLDPSAFKKPGGIKTQGARRPLRVPLDEPSVQEGEDEGGRYLRLSFDLPAGSYATCVTREVCKADA